MRNKICTVKDCGRASYGELCHTHQHRRKMGEPNWDRPIQHRAQQRALCEVEGCGRRSQARSKCKTHYTRWHRGEKDWRNAKYRRGINYEKCAGVKLMPAVARKFREEMKARGVSGLSLLQEILHARYPLTPEELPPRPPERACLVEGCERVHIARGLCNLHRQAKSRGKVLPPLKSTPTLLEPVVKRSGLAKFKLCIIPLCTRGATADGMCSGHYARSRGKREVPETTVVKPPEMPPMRPPSARAKCSLVNCHSMIHAEGLCHRHHWRKSQNLPMTGVLNADQLPPRRSKEEEEERMEKYITELRRREMENPPKVEDFAWNQPKVGYW